MRCTSPVRPGDRRRPELTAASIFVRDGESFTGTELAASPWGPGLLHGGPPAGLLARAIERSRATPDLFVARLTIDLFRPVPMGPLEIRTEVVRAGRRIQVSEAGIIADGVEVARATGLMLLPGEVTLPPGDRWKPETPIGPAGLPTTGLSGRVDVPMRTARPGFHTTIEARRAGGGPGTGRHTSWIRIPFPLIEGEETTPLERAAATADFGNGLSGLNTGDGVGFINADITVHLHRAPVGEWIGLDARSIHHAHGLGLIESRLYDEQGPFGLSTQALIANRRR